MVRLSAILLVLFGESAFAHDHWISRNRITDPQTGEWCCNHIDCAAVPAGGINEVKGGYAVVETGETVPYARVIWRSQDGTWWRCRNLRTNATRCLIGPPQGF
jgi:hypothetical protein